MKIPLLIATLLFTAGVARAEDKPEAKPAPTAPATGSAEVKVGTAVEKHEIVGEATSFGLGTTVVAWSRVLDSEGTVKHVWKHDGKAVWTASMPVKSKRWSTMSRRTVRSPGSWNVDVQNAEGASLGTVSFDVK